MHAFLFIDIEGSTNLWNRQTKAMEVDLARHDELIRGLVDQFGGHVFSTAGDSFAVAFTDVSAARTAIEIQRRVADST